MEQNFWRKEIGEFFLIFLLFALLSIQTLAVLFDADGWPMAHEAGTFAMRTLITASHYKFHDFFPIYSSADNYNFGSPFLAFYHKLFYAVAATLFLIFSDIKIALAAAVWIFLMIGAGGIYGALREIKLSKISAICGGIFLIFANYTVTNWLVRGAMAEFSAAMLIPITLKYFLRMMRKEKINHGLAICLALLFYAHSVIFFYFALFLFLAALVVLRQKFFALIFNKSAISPIALFFILCLPNLWVIFSFWSEYDLSLINSREYDPAIQFHPFYDYFYWNRWRYGLSFVGINCQIDLGLIIGIFVALIVIFWQKKFEILSAKNLASILPLLFILLLCIILQMPLSAFFYEHFSAAKLIQFPWRLLAIATPLLIIINFFLIEKTFAPKTKKILILFCTALMFIFCGAFAAVRYYYIPLYNNLADYKIISFNAFGEYVPRKLIHENMENAFAKIAAHNLEQGCQLTSPHLLEEVAIVKFDFDCQKTAQITLPLFITKFHKISKPCDENEDWCKITLAAGASHIEVEMPNLLSLF